MIDTRGYFNTTHRKWSIYDKECPSCINKNKNDGILEMFIRFKINHILRIENDNFNEKFQEYGDIEFMFNKKKMKSIYDVIQYYLKQKLTIGVDFRIDKNANFFNFTIPILNFGKM